MKRPPKAHPYVPSDAVMRGICQRFTIPMETLTGKSRLRKVVYARAAAIWILRRTGGDTGFLRSYPRVGQIIGGKDHSTVIHGEQIAERLMQTDQAFRAKVLQLTDDMLAGETFAPKIDFKPKAPACLAIIEESPAKPRKKPKNEFEGCPSHEYWVTRATQGSDKLLAAIAKYHPERIAA